MSALRQKEVRLLLRSLEMQGADVLPAKKGKLIRFPNGDTLTVHFTNSDHRSTLNMRAAIKRAGLQWPFDHQRTDKRMALRLTPEQRSNLKALVEGIGTGTTSASAIAEAALVSQPTAQKALTAAGYIQTGRGIWRKPVVVEYPTIDYAKSLPVPAPVPDPVVPEVVAPEPVVQASVERAFIDDADSWTMPVPKKLQAMADLMGLNIEVRVWRTKP